MSPETLTEGVSRTHEIAYWFTGAMIFGFAFGAAYALFRNAPTVASTPQRSPSHTNWHGLPMVDDGGCSEIGV